MNEDGMKFVEYERYCKTCEHKDLPPDQEPCNECLSEPINLNSHKPVRYQKNA